MRLHPGQIRYLQETTSRDTRINLLTCSNRYGKSVLVSCLHLWYLFYKKGVHAGNQEAWAKEEYRTANIAPHSALTEPVFKTIHQIMTSSFTFVDEDGHFTSNDCQLTWWYLKERTLNTPPYKQFFSNNAYIEHRSLANDEGDALQGKPYGLISYDEGGRSNHLENELNDAILPRLFDWHAPFHLLSTPNASSHSVLFHYKLYQKGLLGIDSTYTQEGSLKENIFFSPEQIAEQYALYENNPMRDQVLEGKFVFGGDTLFPLPDVLEAQSAELNDGLRPEPGHSYTIGIDTALGKDERVYLVLDYTTRPFKVARIEAAKGNSSSPQLHLAKLMDLVDLFGAEGQLQIMLETFNEGSVRFYMDLPLSVQAITTCYGTWQPDTVRIKNDNPLPKVGRDVKKADILIELQKILAAHELLIPEQETANSGATTLTEQLSIYKEADKGLPTDRVIALGLANFLAVQGAPVEVAWEAIPW